MPLPSGFVLNCLYREIEFLACSLIVLSFRRFNNTLMEGNHHVKDFGLSKFSEALRHSPALAPGASVHLTHTVSVGRCWGVQVSIVKGAGTATSPKSPHQTNQTSIHVLQDFHIQVPCYT